MFSWEGLPRREIKMGSETDSFCGVILFVG